MTDYRCTHTPPDMYPLWHRLFQRVSRTRSLHPQLLHIARQMGAGHTTVRRYYHNWRRGARDMRALRHTPPASVSRVTPPLVGHPLGHLRTTQRIDATLAILSASGICPPGGWTLEDLADLCGCSREAIRQRETKALDSLRTLLIDAGITHS